ncbi:hypothetical protein GUITHDRAFT_116068 [Guillardia theta CCMP2712]|uniref:Uncharacterized protein n=1 Tax=Guillardia theta (strain CCMP2712) TaxID=905079 RepID=L1INA4_GUITC|nr:hypothetical protein GUITHDRAFT_116068 [Guillardia theta CCMP2712]EKX37761.1 hypothetical protein GUITHDRAFT_116068 [Guillardia theta CCMP2712]|eukprot:XP_005824741.1 hypothetical protein GUITHDRAFT_116068 [Guillardia theta CCMP2712]
MPVTKRSTRRAEREKKGENGDAEDESSEKEPLISERKYRLKWLLGVDGSKRRTILFLIKWAVFIYLVVTFYHAQRWGWLLQGKSFYLPYHSPGNMRKTGLAFRNMFFTIARRHGYSHRDIEKMILFPTESMFKQLSPLAHDARWPSWFNRSEAPGHLSPKERMQYALKQLDNVSRKSKPSQLFEAGETQPFVKMKGDTRNIFRESGAITLVLLPGILSELIDTKLFGDVPAWADSTLKGRWKERMEVCSKILPHERGEGEECDESDTVDRRWSLDKLDFLVEPLAELVDVASIDAKGVEEELEEGASPSLPDGHPLIHLVRFNTPMGSLETMGTIERSSTTFLRRLTKVMRIMGGELKDLYLVGYSRGAAVALELLVQARKSPKLFPWVRRVRGVVSLGGVIYGTEAADTVTQDHLHKKILESVLETVEHVDYSHEGDFGSVGHAKDIQSPFNIVDFLSSSADFLVLRAFFHDLYNATKGKQINDGQVCYDRTMFWPSLITNSKQKPFKGTFLGILGAHHWSIALPSVFDGQSSNFPREVLLETLATFLAHERVPFYKK